MRSNPQKAGKKNIFFFFFWRKKIKKNRIYLITQEVLIQSFTEFEHILVNI